MDERLVDGERTIVAHDKLPEVAQSNNAALDDPAPHLVVRFQINVALP
jgi:hypothetical protein